MAQSEIVHSTFVGVNRRTPPYFIGDEELSECINFNINPDGALVSRYGFNTTEDGSDLGSNDVQVLALFRTSTFSRLVVSNGAGVFWSTDGDAWTELTVTGPESLNNATFAVQYDDNLYILRNDDVIVEWDGTTATELTGTPNGEVGIIHKERLWVVDSTSSTQGSRLHFSDIGDATTFPGSNFIDIQPGDGDIVTALAVYQDVLFIFKLYSTWGLTVLGDAEDWTLRLLSPGIGCSSKWTPREIEGILYFISVRGVYITDGNTFKEISEQIEPIFRNRLIDLVDINKDSAAWWNDRYIAHINRIETPETWSVWGEGSWEDLEGVPWGGDVSAQDYWVYHIRSQGWTRWDFPDGMDPSTFIEIRVATPTRGLYAGNNMGNGRVYIQANDRFVDTLPSGNDSFQCKMKTKRFDYGYSSRFKRLKWVSLHTFGNGTITLQYFVDGQAGTSDSKVASQSDAIYKYAGPGKFQTVQYEVIIESEEESKIFAITSHIHGQAKLIRSGVHG